MTYALLFLLSEGRGIGYGLMLSLVGVVAVFAILTVFMLIIMFLSWITNTLSQRALKKANQPPAAVIAAKREAVSQGELKLTNCSEKDAALIMAIVADNSGIPLENLRFNSIKLTGEEEDK